MTVNRRLFTQMLLLAGASAAVPDFAFATDGTPVAGGQLKFLLQPEPPVLLTLAHTAGPTTRVSGKVTEGLLAYALDFSPIPALATEWEISPDGLQYTFKLRQGVKWHDGKDFTSADVAFSILTLKEVHPRGRATFSSVTEVATPGRPHGDHQALEARALSDRRPAGERIPDRPQACLRRHHRHSRRPERPGADRHRAVHLQGMGAGQPHPPHPQS